MGVGVGGCAGVAIHMGGATGPVGEKGANGAKGASSCAGARVDPGTGARLTSITGAVVVPIPGAVGGAGVGGPTTGVGVAAVG